MCWCAMVWVGTYAAIGGDVKLLQLQMRGAAGMVTDAAIRGPGYRKELRAGDIRRRPHPDGRGGRD